jgi:hypothetical protein
MRSLTAPRVEVKAEREFKDDDVFDVVKYKVTDENGEQCDQRSIKVLPRASKVPVTISDANNFTEKFILTSFFETGVLKAGTSSKKEGEWVWFPFIIHQNNEQLKKALDVFISRLKQWIVSPNVEYTIMRLYANTFIVSIRLKNSQTINYEFKFSDKEVHTVLEAKFFSDLRINHVAQK